MNSTRNIIAGILIGYGAASFVCFLYLDITWAHSAPVQPDQALGLIYRHNEHGAYTYLSAFQATALWLMNLTSVPLFFAGGFVAPRKNVVGAVRWYAASFRWQQDDPRNLLKPTMLAGALTTPLFIFLAGPHIIHDLNAAGFIASLG